MRENTTNFSFKKEYLRGLNVHPIKSDDCLSTRIKREH